jgi:hypothetical protein
MLKRTLNFHMLLHQDNDNDDKVIGNRVLTVQQSTNSTTMYDVM